ncbi:MAG: LPXTG cell wall anchor domain-containing protein, partial [Ilumatobacteraceae bacterium]
CEGDEVIVEEPVAEEEVIEDEVTVAEETAVEDEAPGDDEQDNPITEIVTPDPEEQHLDETPDDVTNDIEVNSNDSVVEAASIVETTPDTEVAPSLNVTADDTDHNALPATGMELSLAFLGLGLAGIGGTLLAVRRRLMIK